MYRGTIYAHYPSTDPQALYSSYCQLSQLEGIRRILPGHNGSLLAPDILEEGLRLLESIRAFVVTQIESLPWKLMDI